MLRSKKKHRTRMMKTQSLLANSSLQMAPLFSLSGKVYDAKLFNFYDGDSFYMTILFHGDLVSFKCRLKGIDTPELRSSDDLEKRLAYQARDRARELANGRVCRVSCSGFEKYGRVLVSVVLENGESLAETLLREKLAFAYDGKKKPTDWVELQTQRKEYLARESRSGQVDRSAA